MFPGMKLFVEILFSYGFITIDDILTYNSLQIFPQGKMNQYQNMCGLSLTYIAAYLKYVILALH